MKYGCECLYCGEKWTTNYSWKTDSCDKCGGREIKSKLFETIDYYATTDQPKDKDRGHNED